MMDKQTEDKLISIFKEKILSPVLYMVEYEDIVDLVCFCDRNITMQTIYDASEAIKQAIDRQVEIIDIREFDEADRLDIIQNARLIYSEDAFLERIFTESMLEDFCEMMYRRESMLERYEENKSPYLQ